MFKYQNTLAKFRMRINIDKEKLKMRPLVWSAGTLLNCVRSWLDQWFQKLKPLIKAYIKGSGELRVKLKVLVMLPESAYNLTADANSMYTTIDTKYTLVIGA
jgi:hypothetical protein